MENRTYIAIDLKSFYASVECVDRGLDPLDTNLVVADPTRTEKTICLAVSPALKSFGVPGRPRLFEVVQKVKEVNAVRKTLAGGKEFTGESHIASELNRDNTKKLSYLVAPPQMARYMQISSQIYQIYLRYVAPEDMHVYSVDEVFIDATRYLNTYHMTGRELAMQMIRDVLKETGITATAGVGTNMYVCKIAMDIVAKKMPADEDGVRIAELDEMQYRRLLWDHRPLTDFWRIGNGYAKKLQKYGMYTMGDVARCSLGGVEDTHNPDLLYRLFGINAELLIDHAWGYEPCTIADIKAFRPQTNSLSSGQVLQSPYPFEKAKLVMKEMTDLLVLDLVDKHLETDQMTLTVGYDIDNLAGPVRDSKYSGKVEIDRYGRQVPKSAHGTVHIHRRTSSTKLILDAVMELFDRIVDPNLLVRRMYVVAEKIMPEGLPSSSPENEQLDFFTDYEDREKKQEQEEEQLRREHKRQEAILGIKKKFGKNAILRGMNLEEGATAKDRNEQIGGHKA